MFCVSVNDAVFNFISLSVVLIDVPECTVTETEKDGSPALVCTANANPQELTFSWQADESNHTFSIESNILSEGMRSYLILDTSIGVERVYYCTVNNTVGKGEPCERKVSGKFFKN